MKSISPGKTLFRVPLIGLAAVLLTLGMQSYAKPPAASTIRPIDDFLDRQGTFCIGIDGYLGYADYVVEGDDAECPNGEPAFLFVPPIAHFVGTSDPAQNRGASIDYAGLADNWAAGAFGTTVAGTVIERPLADGRALVEVLLQTKNALTWVVDLENGDFATDPLLFGNRASEVVSGAEPGLGSSTVQIRFINTEPGAPLPDFLQVLGFPEDGQEMLSLIFSNQAKGPLCLDDPPPSLEPCDGTPGLMTGQQVGLLANPQCGSLPSALADCFPEESIDLRAIGQ